MKTDLLAEKTALVMQNKKWRGCVMSGSLSTVQCNKVTELAPSQTSDTHSTLHSVFFKDTSLESHILARSCFVLTQCSGHRSVYQVALCLHYGHWNV